MLLALLGAAVGLTGYLILNEDAVLERNPIMLVPALCFFVGTSGIIGYWFWGDSGGESFLFGWLLAVVPCLIYGYWKALKSRQ